MLTLLGIQPESVEIDKFGSWVEVGMVLAAIIAGIITILVPLLSRKRKAKKSNTPAVLGYPKNFDWDVHSRLHEILTELRVRTDSARTQLLQFHNTGHFLDGISMKKMSLTHESLENGVSSEMGIKRDLLVSLCIEGLKLLLKDDPKIYLTSSLDDSWCKQLLQSSNVVAFSFLPIRKSNQITGYLMTQWCSWNKADSIDENVVSQEIEDSRVLCEVQLQLQTAKDY